LRLFYCPWVCQCTGVNYIPGYGRRLCGDAALRSSVCPFALSVSRVWLTDHCYTADYRKEPTRAGVHWWLTTMGFLRGAPVSIAQLVCASFKGIRGIPNSKDDDFFRWLVKSSLLLVPHSQPMFSVYQAKEEICASCTPNCAVAGGGRFKGCIAACF